ncbi:hypothetical protein RhiJN_24156 [Ceratobasidium sp. AG-Ba]|nr:hypothetical protein RhiJN_24156 [Ceratobasidium sp. AG-Ba]
MDSVGKATAAFPELPPKLLGGLEAFTREVKLSPDFPSRKQTSYAGCTLSHSFNYFPYSSLYCFLKPIIMPVERVVTSPSVRASPLRKGHYVIPSSLPPPFGVNELYDWSTPRSSSCFGSARSSRSATTEPKAFQRYYHRNITSPSVRGWVEKQRSPAAQKRKFTQEKTSILDFSDNTTSERPLFMPSSPSSSAGEATRTSASPTTPTTPSTRNLEEFQLVRQTARPQTNKIQTHTKAEVRSRTVKKAGSNEVLDGQGGSANTEDKQNFNRKAKGVEGGKGKQIAMGRAGGIQKETQWLSDQDEGEDNEMEEGWGSEDDEAPVEEMRTGEEYGDRRLDEGMSEEEGSEDEGADGNEVVSDGESELSDRGRMRDPVIEELEAAVKRYDRARIASGKNKKKGADLVDKFASSNEKTKSLDEKWSGPSQGLISFRKRPSDQESIAPGKWSYATDGVARQNLKDREVGDLHFSPAVGSDGSGFEYWVVVDSPKRRWATCIEGQGHPKLPGYVLRPREGNKGPGGIRAQSLRANKCRTRKSV